MAGVRDPAFWKRFSMAVHLDEETAAKPELNHSDSWLARQQRKRKRRTCICWIFWLCFFAFVAAVVGVIIWGVQSGVFDGMPNANPNGGQMGSKMRMTRSVVQQLADLRGGRMPDSLSAPGPGQGM